MAKKNNVGKKGVFGSTGERFVNLNISRWHTSSPRENTNVNLEDPSEWNLAPQGSEGVRTTITISTDEYQNWSSR